MANPIAKSQVHPMDSTYISMQAFLESSAKPRSPYPSRFSLASLIKDLRINSQSLQQNTLGETLTQLEALEALLEEKTFDWAMLERDDTYQSLISFVFSSLFRRGQMGFVKEPFTDLKLKYQSDAFLALFDNENWEIRLTANKVTDPQIQGILLAGIVVLRTFYGYQGEFIPAGGFSLRDRNTKMERHFSFDIQLEFLEVKATKPLKKLSQEQIHELLTNLEKPQLWLKYIPPENFAFAGIIIGTIQEVTQTVILSTLKEMAANEGGKSDHEQDLAYLEILARSFLNMPEIQLGVLQTTDTTYIENLTWCLLRRHDKAMIRHTLSSKQSAYGALICEKKAQIIEDLQNHTFLSPFEEELMSLGIRSLLLVPLRNREGNIISIFELGSPQPYRFNQLTLLHLDGFISLIEMGNNRFIQEMNNSLELTIQQEFTSIHPSVEWKFRQVANKYYWESVINKQQSAPDPIVFKGVYPLYGQADIVGSSNQRNQSIQADLSENLSLLYSVLLLSRQALRFHLLDLYAEKVQHQLQRLEAGDFASSDESGMVELMTLYIHPLLRKLSQQFPQLPQEAIKAYFDALDPDLDIIYHHRKDYEDSVSLLNQTISYYMLQEEEKMQGILPHYFEKFQTDGVEYNLYVGQSLLKSGEFEDFYLKDFRLWQLISMCEITRLVERERHSFPVPLNTAQLIFVFNSSLSIRFRMDEKKFDIDGAYNVRYEIIKKRIDKAYIKGTDERLTQAGKVAIVWLQEKDRLEYQEYIDHLVLNGYVSPEVEDLELDRMQGVEGLKAVRLTVLHE